MKRHSRNSLSLPFHQWGRQPDNLVKIHKLFIAVGASKTSQWRSARYHSELSRWQSQPKRSLTLSIGVICRLKQTILQPLVMATVSLTPSSSSSRDQNLAVITVSSWQLLTMESSGAEWETSSSRLPVRQYKGWKISSKHVRARQQRTEVGPLGLECPGRPTGARSSSQTHGPTMPLSRPLLGTYRKTSELSQPLVKGKLFVEGLPMIFIIQFIFFFSFIWGNMENEGIRCNGPELLLGYKINSHYMSLVPRVAAPSTSQLNPPSYSIR